MTATQIKLGISVLIVAGAATALVVQHQAQEKLRAENESLTQQVTQLQTDNESLSNHLAAIGYSKTLADEQYDELLKLRGELGVLHNQAGELGHLREENRRLYDELAVAQNQISQLSAIEYKRHQTDTIDAMKQFVLAMRVFAGDHNQQYATNFDQLKSELGGVTNFPSGIGSDSFEFVNVGLMNGTMSGKMIFRERVARQTPNGKWERVYGMADGSVEVQTSDDRNFDAFEHQHMISPPPNQ
jgi:hypothetical protein